MLYKLIRKGDFIIMQTAPAFTANPAQTMLPLSLIAPGNNPRKHFDPAELDELVASIKEKGVFQPILVRPVEGGFQIVAGSKGNERSGGRRGRIDREHRPF